MAQNKKTKSKLALNKNTLRNLQDLEGVRGGQGAAKALQTYYGSACSIQACCNIAD